MGIIRIADLAFGPLDAANEVSMAGGENFAKTYQLPPQLLGQEDDWENISFVIGPKGAGKTALLHYLQHRDSVRKRRHSEFVYFKRQVDTSAARKLDILPGYRVAHLRHGSKVSEERFKDLWAWFIHRRLYDIVADGGKRQLLRNNAAFDAWFKYVGQFKPTKKSWDWSDLIPAVDGTTVEVGAGSGGLFGRLRFKLGRKKATQSLPEIAAQANQLLATVSGGSENFGLYFDEIEPEMMNTPAFRRDCRLAADLIAVICEFRQEYARNIPNLTLRCALRTEVLRVAIPPPSDLYRSITDRGITLKWDQASTGYDHPLFQILLKKMSASVRRPLAQSFWHDLCPAAIGDIDFHKYALHLTWYRPRDIIRLFHALSAQATRRDPNATTITAVDVERALPGYSQTSWTEIEGELTAAYTRNEILLLKRALTRLEPFFKMDRLFARIRETSVRKLTGEGFLGDHDAISLVETLFRVGVLGNRIRSNAGPVAYKWHHRDNIGVDTTRELAIHTGLWPELQTPLPRARAAQRVVNTAR